MKKNKILLFALSFILIMLTAGCESPSPGTGTEFVIDSQPAEETFSPSTVSPQDTELRNTPQPTNLLTTPEVIVPSPTYTAIPSSLPSEVTLPYDYLLPPVYESSYERMPLIPQPKKQINVLILGSDHFGDRKGYRTDGIILVTINTKEDIVSVTSFPRDLWVYIPGWTLQRINTAYPYGGFESIADTLEYNFGVRPDYYVFIHVTLLEEIVDDLNGITVHAEKTLCDHRSEYNGVVCIYPGEHTMDGPTAFWYAKSRNTIEHDFGRNRRHQELLRGIFDRILELRMIPKIPQLYKTYKKNVDTNMSLVTILKLAPTTAKLVDKTRITQYYIGQDEVINWTTFGGAQVLIPQPMLVRDVLIQALNSDLEQSK
ncbi:MAG: Polyisoprenyl-teichoic acid--peptidoglycan teichoic acid transferase TagT [Chloroflexi bacterium]|nr:Polyisoprenyl-teichoic acid--peptidoglycan teichoic acid transferase TagT [Chloroflexota bacterium]